MRLFRAKKTLAQAIAEHRREIDQQIDGKLKEIADAWKSAERSIQPKIKRLEQRIAQGNVSDGTFYQLQQYRDLERVIRGQVEAFAKASLAATTSGQSKMVGLSDSHLASLIPGKSLAQPNVRALRNLIGSMGDGSPLTDIFAQMGPDSVKVAREILSNALIEGQNAKEIASALSSELYMRNPDRARRIAQTEIMRSYRGATHERYQANSDILSGWRWLTALDGRACAICIGKHGTLHTIDELMESHPDCRCRQVPEIDGLEPIIKITGEEWLRSQPEAVQRKVLLSPGRFDAWKSGIPLGDMIANVNRGRWGNQPRLIPLKALGDQRKIDAWRNLPSSVLDPEDAVNERFDFLIDATKVNVSSTVVLANRFAWTKPAVSSSLGVIDDIHRISGATRTRVIDVLPGATSSVLGGYSRAQDFLYIQPGIDDFLDTVIHEYGHKISTQAIGAGFSASSLGAEFEAWRDAIRNSSTIKSLMELRTEEFMSFERNGETKRILVDRNYVAYSLLWEEIWARSYTQWILSKSSSRAAKAQLAKIKSQPDPYFWVWPDDEFAVISAEIDKIMAKLGWSNDRRRNSKTRR